MAMTPLTRRRFLGQTLHGSAALALGSAARAEADPQAFSFVLLGDLHYDKLEHHDMGWLLKHHAGDLSQIENYSRLSAENTPRLFKAVRETVAESGATLIVQVGDLVEGLCGSAELAVRQNREAIEFVETQRLGAPFVFTKGNHDVTGDGAEEAFKEVFHPFLNRQTAGFKGGGAVTSACHTIEHADVLFCFFDAYDRSSLDWLEAALSRRTARHCFVVVHPPVVPYGARATWHLYASERDQTRRDKLLALLGEQEAFVLGGHIHRFNLACRQTPQGGRFAQFALSSVISKPEVKPATELSGVEDYNGDQIRVEPRHSPETEQARRAVYAKEAPLVKAFAYADLPGHAVISIQGEQVRAVMHAGITREIYQSVDLVGLLKS